MFVWLRYSIGAMSAWIFPVLFLALLLGSPFPRYAKVFGLGGCLVALMVRAILREERDYSDLTLKQQKWSREGRCPQCGYDLTGNTTGRCSECGHHWL